MSFPLPPKETVQWDKLGLAVQDEVNGHVESTYTAVDGKWSEPKFVRDPYIRVHGLSPALNYGTYPAPHGHKTFLFSALHGIKADGGGSPGMQAYEGLKAHRASDGTIHIFRPSAHAARLSSSAACVSIPAIPESHFLKCVKLAVARNSEWVGPNSSEALLYIRPVVFGSSGHLALTAPAEFTFAVYVQPGTTYHGVQPLPACVIEDFDRAAPRGTGGAKVGGNYAPAIRYTDRAKAEGFHVTLHLDAQTRNYVEEFSTSGFVGIRHARGDAGVVTLVVPESKNVVQSITSDSVLALARSFGWTVEQREIPWSECKDFDEVVAVGTAASLLPIRLLVRPSTGDKFIYGETTGECTAKLTAELRRIMRGEVEDSFSWLDKVTADALL